MTLLDICCGEGYYTSAMGAVSGVDAYGFDLGKEMVRLAAKRGDVKKSDLQGASRSMEKSMSEKELHDMASTSRKGKPEHAAKH